MHDIVVIWHLSVLCTITLASGAITIYKYLCMILQYVIRPVTSRIIVISTPVCLPLCLYVCLSVSPLACHMSKSVALARNKLTDVCDSQNISIDADCKTHAHVLRLLHCSPEVPAGQSQMTVLTASWHWPPLRHGLDSQDTLSESTMNTSLRGAPVVVWPRTCAPVYLAYDVKVVSNSGRVAVYCDRHLTSVDVDPRAYSSIGNGSFGIECAPAVWND